MRCCKCDAELVTKQVTFTYLDHEMYHPVKRCPVCGQVFIPEELVDKKISLVETELEDK